MRNGTNSCHALRRSPQSLGGGYPTWRRTRRAAPVADCSAGTFQRLRRVGAGLGQLAAPDVVPADLAAALSPDRTRITTGASDGFRARLGRGRASEDVAELAELVGDVRGSRSAGCGCECGGEVARALQRGQVPDAVDVLQPDVGEVGVEPVGRGPREQRVVFGSRHRGRRSYAICRPWRCQSTADELHCG